MSEGGEPDDTVPDGRQEARLTGRAGQGRGYCLTNAHFLGALSMFSTDEDAANYEFNARFDYLREAFGDPCPTHGTLRGGGDCAECLKEWENDVYEAEAATELEV